MPIGAIASASNATGEDDELVSRAFGSLRDDAEAEEVVAATTEPWDGDPALDRRAALTPVA